MSKCQGVKLVNAKKLICTHAAKFLDPRKLHDAKRLAPFRDGAPPVLLRRRLKTHILFFYYPETYLIFLLSEDAPLRQGTLETRDPGSRSASLAHLTDAATLMCRTAALKGEVARGLAAGLGPNPLSLNCDICTAIGIVLSEPWGESGIGNAREATAGNVKP